MTGFNAIGRIILTIKKLLKSFADIINKVVWNQFWNQPKNCEKSNSRCEWSKICFLSRFCFAFLNVFFGQKKSSQASANTVRLAVIKTALLIYHSDSMNIPCVCSRR